MIQNFFRVFLFIFCLSIAGKAVAQREAAAEYTLSGQITDAKTGQSIPMASFIVNHVRGVISDKDGKFSLGNLKEGEITYSVSFLGYQAVERKLYLNRNIKDLKIKLTPLSLGLDEVVVTAKPSSIGSSSTLSETAIRHIQPKSIDDMLQLIPGNLSKNPNLSLLGQASIREIGANGNNSLGTAVIVDGAPLSNDGNLQALSPSLAGGKSNLTLNGMADQTTSGKGIDLRTLSPDNVESMEVIRGIPSAEYGNLTSGVVVVKTKAGVTPWELKFKADPFSKMVFAGKGFALKNGGAVNLGVDWSQSYGDTRKHYLGYDRITATAGYSDVFRLAGRPLTFNLRGAFYSNVNNSKDDPQMAVTQSTYKNKNVGGRLNIEGNWKLNGALVSDAGYSFMVSQAFLKDQLHEYIASPSGIVSNALAPGVAEAIFLQKSYYSDYKIDGKPLNVYAQLKANKMIQFGTDNFTNLKVGADWRYDHNFGNGLEFDINFPPQNQNSQSLRPRSFRDIPALNNLAFFVEDKLNMGVGTTRLTIQAGVRLSDLFLDRQSLQDNIFMVEPRVNALWSLLSRDKFELSLTGGWGVSYKAPTLLYLYPDDVYFDRVSLGKYSDTDPSASMALMTTDVLTEQANPDLKPAKSMKYEAGFSLRWGRVRGLVTYFREKHTDEFGFQLQPHFMHYNTYTIPEGASGLQFNDGTLTYAGASGETIAVTTLPESYIATYYKPANNSRSEKQGVEYSLDFGMIRPIRTSLIVDGAWFHIKRTNTADYYSKVDENFRYIALMPGGNGTIQNRINTNFRFITHIPKLKLVFSTTMQVVWYESGQNIWRDTDGHDRFTAASDGKFLNTLPLGFYDRQGNYTAWQSGYEDHSEYSRMVDKSLLVAFDREKFDPWVMFNFRLTEEIGKILDLSFTANNFTGTSRWHYYKTRTGYKQVFPDMYFGAELTLKIGGR